MGKMIFELLALKSKELYIDLMTVKSISKVWYLINSLRTLLFALSLLWAINMIFFMVFNPAKNFNAIIICEAILILVAVVPYAIIRKTSVSDFIFSLYKLMNIVVHEYNDYKRAACTAIKWSMVLSTFVFLTLFVVLSEFHIFKNQTNRYYHTMLAILSVLIAVKYTGYLYRKVDTRISIVSIMFEACLIFLGNIIAILQTQWELSTLLTIYGLITTITDYKSRVVLYLKESYTRYDLQLSSGISAEIRVAKKKYIKNQRAWLNKSSIERIKFYGVIISMTAFVVLYIKFVVWSDVLNYFVSAVISNHIVMNILTWTFLLGISSLFGYAVVLYVMSNTKSAATSQQTIRKIHYFLNVVTIIAMLVVLVNCLVFDVVAFYTGCSVFIFCQFVNWIIKKKINKLEN
jgi:hypothetical protein